jgi:unsaturated chondroitin disaccharide hydrolase
VGRWRSGPGQALAFAQEQVRGLIARDPDYFPLYTEGGRWRHGKEAWTNWCEGFLGGMMWIFARRTDDPFWRERAEHYSRLIEERQHDRDVHDLGFLFWSTWKRWFDLDGDLEIERRVIAGGRTMGLRFNERGKYLRSFVAPESCFIDIMMNVGIVFYAADRTGDADLLRRATEHCLTTRRYLVRGDGSTAHEGIFDPESGQFLRQTTHQGWRDDSSWARGQGWALYGFGTAYRPLRGPAVPRHRSALRRLLHRADAAPRRPAERLGAARSATPLRELGRGDRRQRLVPVGRAVRRPGPRRTLRCLRPDDPRHAALARVPGDRDPGWEGILRHGSYHETLGLGVDESVMWGEYFFVEALDKLLGAPAAA